MTRRLSALALCCLLCSPAAASDLAGEALSLLIQGPDAAERVDKNTFVVRTDQCGSEENARCKASTDTLSITGKCTAERRIEDRGWWKKNNRDEAANFSTNIIKYDFSKAAIFDAVEDLNRQGAKASFFVFRGERGVMCSAYVSDYGKKVAEPTKFECYPSPVLGVGGPLDVQSLGTGPVVADRARKAAAYYRANVCAGKPF